MKSHTEYLTFHIKGRVGFENITPKVDAAVRKSGVKDGLVLVNAMHITASVFINDDEHGLHQDYAKWLETLAPFDASPQRYAHNRTGEDNADAHMKRQIMGREVVVAITNGKLDFGPWEQIFYGEFDGNRNKRVLIKVIGGSERQRRRGVEIGRRDAAQGELAHPGGGDHRGVVGRKREPRDVDRDLAPLRLCQRVVTQP